MKKLIPLAALLLTAASLPAKTFEGYVHYKMTHGKDSMDMSYALKEDKMRFETDVSGAQSVGLFNAKEGEMYILMPAQQMYMRFSGMGKAISDATTKTVDFEETGRKEKIAGYECSEFIVRDKKEVHEIWATEDLGRYISFMDAQKSKGKNPAWAQLLLERNLFPLRTVTKDNRGRERARMEATSVEPKSLPDEMFEIPEGYTEFAMPNLGGLLKSLGR